MNVTLWSSRVFSIGQIQATANLWKDVSMCAAMWRSGRERLTSHAQSQPNARAEVPIARRLLLLLLHDSLLRRLHNDPDYKPNNTRGDDKIHCLIHSKEDVTKKFDLKEEDRGVVKDATHNVAEKPGVHNIWTFRGEGTVLNRP